MGRLGEYDLVCRLDRRSPAPLFAARRRHQPALLRVLDPAPAAWWAQFRRELPAAGRVQHPSHLTLVDAGDREGRPFLAYEPAFGIVLADADLDRDGLPVPVAAAVALSLLEGVEHVHARDVALGPVGLERILATFDGRFLWMDAGLSTTAPSRPPSAARACGAAPESGRRGPQGPAADLYAVGRLLASLGPTPTAPDQPATPERAAWFAALGVLLDSEPAARDASACRAQLAAWCDPERASRYTRDRHRRVAARLAAALDREEIDPSTDLPATPQRAHRGSGIVAGSTGTARIFGHVVERRVPSASPLPLYATTEAARPYWLRIMDPAQSKDASYERAFTREAELARELVHPALPVAADVSFDGAIAYARSPGRPLTEWLHVRPPGDAGWRRFASSLADLLETLHGVGLVAANLQPSAIHVAADGRSTLVDRGFIASPDALDPWLQDNLHALAPEYFSARRHDEASDRFALGALLYQVLTGTRPFRGLSPRDVIDAMERGRPRPVRSLDASVDRSVAELIDGLLDPEPEARPSLGRIRDVVGALGREVEPVGR